MPPLPRPEIERVAPVTHGGYAATRADAALLDFSANINPYGPSPRVWAAMRAVEIGQHPDPRATLLRHALAQREGLSPAQLLVGNGSVDLLYQLAVAYLRASDPVIVVEPTFGEYAAAAAIMGARVCAFHTYPEDSFALDVDAFLEHAQRVNPRLIFLCNPNNPTGVYLDYDTVERVLRACPDTLVVLDEAFVRFVAAAWPARALLDYDNLLILRSLTKDYALTGLRVGYALAHPAIISALAAVQPPWSVNALAQAAALAALPDEEHLRASLVALQRARDALVDDLAQIRMYAVPSHVHFFLLPVPSAADWTRQLLDHDILVRDCTSFGLPTFIRIATRRPEENAQLLTALAEIGGRLCRVRS